MGTFGEESRLTRKPTGYARRLAASWVEPMAAAYSEHAQSVMRLAYSITGNHASAEELVQEAFVRVFGRPRSISKRHEVSAYLHRTVINLARSRWRKQRLENISTPDQLESIDRVRPPDVATQDFIFRALLTLPVRQRAAIYLRYYEDLSEVDIAERLNCSVAAARSLTHRGLTTLRRNIKE
jgi:RNA polymerase sigma-70 factor (sigma-E family)